jgi:TRAP-type C4-dicarboxylate transport system substrate-binding protein
MRRVLTAMITVALLLAAAPASAQQVKLKWAHVYEVTEPYHKWAI